MVAAVSTGNWPRRLPFRPAFELRGQRLRILLGGKLPARIPHKPREEKATHLIPRGHIRRRLCGYSRRIRSRQKVASDVNETDFVAIANESRRSINLFSNRA
jgi:hypothetical protein